MAKKGRICCRRGAVRMCRVSPARVDPRLYSPRPTQHIIEKFRGERIGRQKNAADDAAASATSRAAAPAGPAPPGGARARARGYPPPAPHRELTVTRPLPASRASAPRAGLSSTVTVDGCGMSAMTRAEPGRPGRGGGWEARRGARGSGSYFVLALTVLLCKTTTSCYSTVYILVTLKSAQLRCCLTLY